MNDKDFVNILVFLKFVIVEKIKPYKADPNNPPNNQNHNKALQ